MKHLSKVARVQSDQVVHKPRGNACVDHDDTRFPCGEFPPAVTNPKADALLPGDQIGQQESVVSEGTGSTNSLSEKACHPQVKESPSRRT